MALLGSAALAMWWDVGADMLEEFEDWHTHEHFPERLGIAGFRRASRWRGADGGAGIFVMYELADYGVLSSSGYLERLNAPTPWSVKMMPHHRNMVRSQCRVLESRGVGVAGHALTVRFSPQPRSEPRLRDALRSSVAQLAIRPGIAGAHLLRHQRPPVAQTAEQRIRGGDREADWILVVTGYDAPALTSVARTTAGATALAAAGAADGAVGALYTLSCSATPADVT